MNKETKIKAKTVEVLYTPVSSNTDCLGCSKTIPKGEKAIQSLSTPGRSYHPDCFKDLVREAGKNPKKFIKIITPSSENS